MVDHEDSVEPVQAEPAGAEAEVSDVPDEVQPTPEVDRPDVRTEAVQVVLEKLQPINDKVAALGLTRVEEDGTETPVRHLFDVQPLDDEPEPSTYGCPVCQEQFTTGPGLKRHMTRKHKDAPDTQVRSEPETHTNATSVVAERPEKPAVPLADLVPTGKSKAGIRLSAIQLFDGFLAELLPPPLTDNERALLEQVDVSVTVPDWAFKYAVLLYILGPRLASKFRVLKDKFDADVAAEEAKREAEKQAQRNREAAERARQAAERAQAEAAQREPRKPDPFESAKVEW